MKCGRSVCLPLVAHEPYVNQESWMLHTSPVKCGCPVCRTCKSYVDGYGKLPEEREDYGKTGNLLINL